MEESRSSLEGAPLRTPADEWTPRILNSSPIHNFERLSVTAKEPKALPDETLTVDGKPIVCQVLEFTSGRRELRTGEHAGRSKVWVAKDSLMVLQEEINTTAGSGEEMSVTKRKTTVTMFVLNQGLSPAIFSTASAAKS